MNKIVTCWLISCCCVQINAAHLQVDADKFMAKFLKDLGPEAQARLYNEVTGKKLKREHSHWATCKIEDGRYLKIEWDGTTFFALIGAADNLKKLALINKKVSTENGPITLAAETKEGKQLLRLFGNEGRIENGSFGGKAIDILNSRQLPVGCDWGSEYAED